MTDTLIQPSAEIEEQQQRASVGAQLKAAREAQALAIAEVAHRLKLSPRQLAALEVDDYAALPGNTFIRGFVRNYARQLGLEPQPLLDQLAEILPPERLQVAMPRVTEAMAYERGLPFTRSSRRAPWGVWLFVLLGLLLGAGGVFWYLQQPATPVVAMTEAPLAQPVDSALPQVASAVAEPEPVAQVAEVASAVELPAPPALEPNAAVPVEPIASAPAEAVMIRIETGAASSWVLVTDAAGQTLISQLLPAHSVRSASGQAPFKLKIGNAPNARLAYQGAAVELTPHIRGDVATLELK